MEKMSEEEAKYFFEKRPKANQVAACSSEQSSVIPSREVGPSSDPDQGTHGWGLGTPLFTLVMCCFPVLVNGRPVVVAQCALT